MAKMKHTFSKKFLSVFLCIALIMTYLPVSVMAAAGEDSTSVADPKTLSQWENWFSENSSRYSGGIFLDKSVYTASEAKTDKYFTDIRDSLSIGNDNFGNENFMIALSALGSNSEILGYSHTPTDTMLVLDASTSMGTGDASSSAIDDMVSGANEAIKRLLALNNYNRVGVVIYNGTASVLLPLDRYTAGNSNGDILRFERTVTGGTGSRRDPYTYENRIYIASSVRKGNGTAVDTDYNAQAQGTYTQGGIYAAAQEFLAADTVIEDGKIQGGTNRIPIMVLMTDGEPSYRTQTGNNNTINRYNAATNNNADRTNFREDDITAFSTMLTAAWAEAEITAHYNIDTRFYTLGYALSANHQYAQNVLDPMNPNNSLARRFSRYATQYLNMSQNATSEIRNENNQVAFRITRASSPDRVTTLDYADRYWQASQASQLSGAFDSIVDEIVIQSRYYSTLVESNNHAQDGFVSFTDEIGTYMEVKDIKGIYIGDGKLVSGGMFAEFAATGKVDDYDNTNYDHEQLNGFENEILSAISERFSISLSEAALLLNTAKENGFISYADKDNFSNYIAWYADENNNYVAPYSNTSVHSQSNAKYIVRSYFYMGDVMQNHVETSMLYALVRVREDIKTGRQIVDMDIPAALLPLVTYTITVEGNVLSSENVTGVTCQQKKPISLLFEVGLDSEITPINITEKVGEAFRKDANGVYTFYTNRWRDNDGDSFSMPNANQVDPHIFNHGIMNTTVAQFIPSLENERYYFTENAQILDSSHNVYTGSKPTGGNYFVEYKWVEGNASSAVLRTAYNPISSEIFKDADSIIQIDGKDGWFIKKGTPQFYFGEEVHGEQAHSHKTDNTTETLLFSDYPQVVYHESEGHTGYHMLNYHGNNGLIKATPTQGIKLSKTVSQTVANVPDTFEFEITLSGTALKSSYPVYIEYADGTSNTLNATVTGGKISVTLGDGDVAYIYDLAPETEYTVTEKYNQYYAGASSNASGTVELHALSEVDFVNSPKGFGSLLVEKDVTHPFATISSELAEKEFDITVEFKGYANDLALIKASDNNLNPTVGNGIYTYSLKLKDGHDVLFTNIPEGVEYSVAENNIPTGFTLETADLSGAIARDTQSEVLLVNDYNPDPVSPNITISGEKTLNGRDWNSEIDKYQVALQQVAFGGQGTVAIGEPIFATLNMNQKTYSLNVNQLKKEDGTSPLEFDKVGTYNFVVYEVFPSDAQDRVPNIKYDSTFAFFSVEIIDDASGVLKVGKVTLQPNAQEIEKGQNGHSIVKDFTNYYQTATVSVPILKNVVDKNNATVSQHNAGILFGLFDSADATVPIYSTLTAADGSGTITFPVLRDSYTNIKYYYVREVLPPIGSQVVGMTYDTSVKYVVSVQWVNNDVEYYFYNYDAQKTDGIGDLITDKTAPLTFTNTYDDNVVSNPINFGGTKTLNGGALRNGDEFTIELYKTGADFKISSPSLIKLVNVNSSNAAYSFDNITFDSEGTKYLVVREKNDSKNGITYDNTTYHITVDVAKTTNSDNKTVLMAESIHIHQVGKGDVDADKLNFNNTYTITDSEEVVINGKKTLNGRTLVEGEFEFEITAETPDAPMPSVTRVKNDADGNFSFPIIRYNVSNEETYNETYTYKIREVVPNGDKKGITYSSKEYTLVVTLADDNSGGITKTVKLDNQTVFDVNVAFENSYAAADTDLIFSGAKAFNKKSGEFYFDLYETGNDFATASNVIPETAKATVENGRGEYSITLNYESKDKGYHYYVLKEAVPAETKGILYDSTEYHITVNALDNGHGEMEAHVMSVVKAHTSETATVTTLNFTNEYRASEASVIIGGKKLLEGRELAENEFKFFLYPADETYAVDEDATAKETKNNADGSFAFDTITFSEVGTYYFVVLEDPDTTAERVTNDTTVYNVAIEIKDDDNGKLYEASRVIKKVGSDDAVEEIVFKNVFTPKTEEITSDGAEATPEEQHSPKTGDNSNLHLWFALLFVSGSGIITLTVYDKKKRTKEN